MQSLTLDKAVGAVKADWLFINFQPFSLTWDIAGGAVEADWFLQLFLTFRLS